MSTLPGAAGRFAGEPTGAKAAATVILLAPADSCATDTCDAASGCSHARDPSCAGQDFDGDGHIAVTASVSTPLVDPNPANQSATLLTTVH